MKLAGVAKGTRLYVEGSLTQTKWNAADGEVHYGLNVAAWKAEKVGRDAIGRQRPPREKGQEFAGAGSNRNSAAYCGGPADLKRPGAVGRDDFEHEGGDRFPF